MTIPMRTIKIVSAASLAIILSQFLSLESALAAGVIAILSVLETKQESLLTAAARIGSTVIGFIVATGLFYWIGFNIFAFGLYLCAFIPLSCLFRLQSGIAPTTVLVTHFMTAESISWYWQVNGMALMVIGVSAALLVNMWMPSQQDKLKKTIFSIEQQMSETFIMFQEQLLGEKNYKLVYQQLRQLESTIQQMDQLAFQEYENQVFNRSSYYVKYAQMRKEQQIIMQKICDNLPLVHLATEQNDILADLFVETAARLHEQNTGLQLLHDISDLYDTFKRSPLPATREEFESRAILYQILTDFERFIKLKREFYIDERQQLEQRL